MAESTFGTRPQFDAPTEQESLGRMLRHEVGDFLQKVYASVAILQARLPKEQEQEREVLSRLRARAEWCRNLIDAVQDFLCPITLAFEPIDLKQLLIGLSASLRQRFPNLEIKLELGDIPIVVVDPERIRQIGHFILSNACEAARQRVVVKLATAPAATSIVWSIEDDGPGIDAQLIDHLFMPFFTTRPGHAGLGLALAQKLVHLHDGTITSGNRQDNGFEVVISLPTRKSI